MTEESGMLQSMGSQRVGHDLTNEQKQLGIIKDQKKSVDIIWDAIVMKVRGSFVVVNWSRGYWNIKEG